MSTSPLTSIKQHGRPLAPDYIELLCSTVLETALNGGIAQIIIIIWKPEMDDIQLWNQLSILGLHYIPL